MSATTQRRRSSLLAAWGLCALVAAACSAEGGPRIGDPVGKHQNEIRPTDGTGWNGNGYGAVKVEHWDTPGGRFRVHYTREGKHAVPSADANQDQVPDFVEEFGKTFDDVLAAYVKAGLREPLSDETLHDRPDYGGDGRFDVYLQDQGKGADGYLVTEACMSGVPPRCAGYMVVENDFVGYSYKTPQEGMKILASHEFFHAVQNAYRRGLGQSFSEGTAVWGTELVYPDSNDFERFLPYFFNEAGRPIDDVPNGQTDVFAYATAIWPRFLSERFGKEVLPAIFEELSEKGKAPTALDAVDTVLKRDHQSTLSEAFAEFTLWNLFTKSRVPGAASAVKHYQNAASYPEVGLEQESRPHPYRITGKIAYLSARYFELSAKAGERITVVSERAEAKLRLHLITGDLQDPVVVSSKAGETSVAIDAQGKVLVVAASTARSGGKGIPLSLVVTGKAAPPVSDAGVGDDSGGGGSGGGDDGGCAVSGETRGGALFGVLAIFALLGFARRWRSTTTLMILAALLMTAGACSDDSAQQDAAVVQDKGSSDLGPDLAPDSGGPLTLGQIVDFEADTGGVIQASVKVKGDEELMLLLLSHDREPLVQRSYSVIKSTATRHPRPSAGLPRPALPERAKLRGSNSRFFSELATLLRTTRQPLWKSAYSRRGSFDSTPPKVGDTRQFKLRAGQSEVTISAEALRVDSVAVFWIDTTTTPLASIDAATLKELGDNFAQVVIPRERTFFGKESDVDKDGLIHVLLSPRVNDDGAVAYVSPCDLVDAGKLAGCVTGNGMELIYLTPPSDLKPPYNTPKAMLETIAHEFQHSVYFYRKFVLNKAEGTRENPYVTEGLSHLAQDLTGYQAGNLYVQMATLQSIDLVAIPNVFDPKISSYIPQPGDGIMRGAGYFVLRYLYDRAGGDLIDGQGTIQDKGGIAWLHSFIDNPKTGLPSALDSAKLSYEDFVDGFWTTMALSNRVAGGKPVSDDPRYSFLPTTSDNLTGRQRGCDLFASFHASQMVGPKTQELKDADGKLRPGGAELLVAKVPSGNERFEVTFQVDPALEAKLRIIRIR